MILFLSCVLNLHTYHTVADNSILSFAVLGPAGTDMDMTSGMISGKNLFHYYLVGLQRSECNLQIRVTYFLIRAWAYDGTLLAGCLRARIFMLGETSRGLPFCVYVYIIVL